jgi:hypothetical protein
MSFELHDVGKFALSAEISTELISRRLFPISEVDRYFPKMKPRFSFIIASLGRR